MELKFSCRRLSGGGVSPSARLYPVLMADCFFSKVPFVEFCSGQDARFNKTGRHKQPCQRVVDGMVLGALHSSAGSWRYLNLCWLCLGCGAAKRALGSSTNSSCGPCSVGLTTGSSKRGWILHLLRFSEMSARTVYRIYFFFPFFSLLFFSSLKEAATSEAVFPALPGKWYGMEHEKNSFCGSTERHRRTQQASSDAGTNLLSHSSSLEFVNVAVLILLVPGSSKLLSDNARADR